MLNFQFSDSFYKHPTLGVFSINIVLVHDINILWFSILEVFWAEVRVKHMQTIATKDIVNVYFTVDLIIDPRNHFIALVVAHFKIQT